MVNFKNLFIFSAMAILTLCFSTVGVCDPVINKLTGTFANGQSVVLDGANFGPQGPNLILYDDFEGGTTGLTIPLTSPRFGSGWSAAGPNAPVYSSVAHSGNHSMLTSNNGATLQFKKNFAPVTEAFVSFWVRIPDGTHFPATSATKTFPSGGFWKMMWLMDGDGGYNSDNNIVLGSFITANTWTLFTNNDGFNMYQEPYRSGSNNWWTWDGWMRHTYWLKGGANPEVDAGSAYIHVLTEGTKQIEYNGPFVSQGPFPFPLFKAGVGNGVPQWNRLNVPGYIAPSDTNTHPVYDDIYVATGPNARARIDIGDNATYGLCKKISLSVPTSWSDNKLMVNVQHPPGFNLGDTAYIFIFDSNGLHNTNGYPVKIGTKYPEVAPAINLRGVESK